MHFISIQVFPDSLEGYTVQSTEGQAVHIGRRAADEIDFVEDISIVLSFPDVSARHALISFGTDTSRILGPPEQREWTFTDLGSTNGSALNGMRLTVNRRYALTVGDRILIADKYELKVLSCSTSASMAELKEQERELIRWQEGRRPEQE